MYQYLCKQKHSITDVKLVSKYASVCCYTFASNVYLLNVRDVSKFLKDKTRISSPCMALQIVTPETWNLNNFTVAIIITLSSIEGFCYFIYNFKLVCCMVRKSCQHHVFVNFIIMNENFVNWGSLVSFLESPELKDKLLLSFESFTFSPKFNDLFNEI